MKRYKLLKDLAGLKAGSTLYLNELGNLVAEDKTTIVFLANFIHYYNILDSDWLEEIPEENKRWRAGEGERYWLVRNDGELADDREIKTDIDDWRYELGNYFKTEEEAQKASDWLKAFAVLRGDTKGFKPDWGDSEQDKWFIFYDHVSRHLWSDLESTYQDKNLYFASEDDAVESIKAHERQWRIYYGVEE